MMPVAATPGTMCSNVTVWADATAGGLHAWLLAGKGVAPGLAHGRGLAFVTLACWLIAEGLGAYMLGRWVVGGGPRQQRGQPGRVSLPVVLGHAGLAFTGFACWVSFLMTGSPALAWVAIGFLALAIGLGISTVTVWTPYPARRDGVGDGQADHGSGSGAPAVSPGHARSDGMLAGTFTNERLALVLSDEALTSRLVDDLLARMLAVPLQRRTGRNGASRYSSRPCTACSPSPPSCSRPSPQSLRDEHSPGFHPHSATTA